MNRLRGYTTLIRPANLPTAMADILAGATVSFAVVFPGGMDPSGLRQYVMPLTFLCLSSVLLYASGVVFNDYFDRETDAKERPERPIPSGVVPASNAAVFGSLLLIAGVVFAFMGSWLSGGIAVLLATGILVYDVWAKHSTLFGPLIMGLCRGFNLLLGMSILGFPKLWWMIMIPILYIGAITLVSRGEVNGNNKTHIQVAFMLYLLVLVFVFGLHEYGAHALWYTIPFIAVFSIMVFAPLWWAYQDNTPGNIKRAVKAGVISLILLDACIAVIFAGWQAGLSVLLLLPLSILLSRQFAVT